MKIEIPSPLSLAIDKAKKYKNREKRKWLGPVVLDSYGGESNRAYFFALEGSPPRAYLIAQTHKVIWIDGSTERVKIFDALTGWEE
jgi:hypothetical protein